MHTLQPSHRKLNKEEVDKLLKEYNISAVQLPKIYKDDKGIPENYESGDILEIERKTELGVEKYYRVVF
jgi:DNA-directed RNA polymerase subunit H (RpoH/RPB5)